MPLAASASRSKTGWSAASGPPPGLSPGTVRRSEPNQRRPPGTCAKALRRPGRETARGRLAEAPVLGLAEQEERDRAQNDRPGRNPGRPRLGELPERLGRVERELLVRLELGHEVVVISVDSETMGKRGFGG